VNTHTWTFFSCLTASSLSLFAVSTCDSKDLKSPSSFLRALTAAERWRRSSSSSASNSRNYHTDMTSGSPFNLHNYHINMTSGWTSTSCNYHTNMISGSTSKSYNYHRHKAQPATHTTISHTDMTSSWEFQKTANLPWKQPIQKHEVQTKCPYWSTVSKCLRIFSEL